MQNISTLQFCNNKATEDEKIIGIVGGMGPKAGLKLYDYIIRNTAAITDQQYFSTVLMSFSKEIVDRTLYLEGIEKINPAYNIAQIIRKLHQVGANIIGIACNTSYSPKIYNVILDNIEDISNKLKLVNMPYETCKFLKENYPGHYRIGLVATNGTYKYGTYKDVLEEMGMELIIPDFKYQNNVIHDMIYNPKYGIKAQPNVISTQLINQIRNMLHYFENRKVDALILGCTELSLLKNLNLFKDIAVIDSTSCLALALLREAACLKMNQPIKY